VRINPGTIVGGIEPWSETQPTVPLAEMPSARRHKDLSQWSTMMVTCYSLPHSNQAEKVMRKFPLLAGVFGRRPVLDRGRGSNQVEAMTFANIPGALGALVTSDDATKSSPGVPRARLPRSLLRTAAVLLGLGLF
jgi:hypothetical protein